MLIRSKIYFLILFFYLFLFNVRAEEKPAVSAPTASDRAISSAAISDANVVKQRQHPFLFADKAIIERAKERAKKFDWAGKIFEKMEKEADKILSEPTNIPSVGGQWSHHYVCKKCGTRLINKDNKHICPKCKTEYTGWPYDEVIAGHQHRENLKAVETLGLVYALTGDEKYAKKASEILLAYAERYTSFPIHDYKGGTMKRGARLFAQTLDESTSIIGTVWGYDLIYSSKSLSDADREKIENKFFREVAKTISRNDMGISNWQSWHNAALTVIGYCIGDEKMVNAAIDGESGFKFQMAKSVLDDGFWYEGSPSYHFYALNALRYTAEAAYNAGLRLVDDPKYRSMFGAPTNYIFPDSRFPAVNDSDAFSIDEQHALYEIAYARYKNPRYASIAAKGNRKSIEALFGGEDILPDESVSQASIIEPISDFPNVGAVILRQGNYTTDSLCVHIHYGPHGGAHGHPDKLGLIVFGDGREILLDAGRVAYGSPLYGNWYKTTLAHNTIIVDEQNQKPTQVDSIRFNKMDGLCSAQSNCSTAYPGVALMRTVVVTQNYLLYIFTADSESSHTYDLAYHIKGKVKPYTEMKKDNSLSKKNGYQILEDVTSQDVLGNWRMNFKEGKNKEARLTMIGGEETTRVFIANGLVGDPPKPCPVVMLRRTGNSTRYITLLEPNRIKSSVKEIKAEEIKKADEKGLHIQIAGEFGKDVLEINMPKITQDKTESQKENFIRFERNVKK